MEVRMPPSPIGTATAGTDLPLVWPHPDGDPRLKWPTLAEHFTPKRLLAWVHHQKCLCGCGRETKALRGRSESGHSYFTNKCWPKIARKYDLRPAPTAPARRDPAWLEAVRKENDARLCTVEDTEWYVGMVVADCEDRQINFRQWAREKGFHEDYLYQLTRAAKHGQRITKYNAARLLKALGEKVPEDFERRYQGRIRQTKKRVREQAKAQRKVS